MDAKETRLVVLKALVQSKATWKLVGIIAVVYGVTHGELIAELVGEVVADIVGAL